MGLKKTTIKVGDTFTLKCGVTVWVLKYVDCHHVTITDGVHAKVVTATILRSLKVSWWDENGKGIYKSVEQKISINKEYGLAQKYKVGKRFMGVDEYFTITHIDEFVHVLFDSGVKKKFKADGHFRTSKCSYKNPNSRIYYVYIAKAEDKIVYVGKGNGDRYKHVNSGTSSSWFLNSLHFKGIECEVTIVRNNLTNYYAIELEEALLFKLKPVGNSKIPTSCTKNVEILNIVGSLSK